MTDTSRNQFFRQLLEERNYRTRTIGPPFMPFGRLILDEGAPIKNVYFFVDRTDGEQILKNARNLRIGSDLYKCGTTSFDLDDGELSYAGWFLLFHNVSM